MFVSIVAAFNYADKHRLSTADRLLAHLESGLVGRVLSSDLALETMVAVLVRHTLDEYLGGHSD